MKNGDNKRPSRKRLLSWEEIALWRHATADVKPRGRKAPPENRPDSQAELPTPLAAKSPPAAAARKFPSPAVVAAPQRQAKAPATPAPLAPLDRRLKRRLSSGRAEIDDVIDLHGMTQAQAHRALNTFLWRAAESGAKIVLVVTGKGKMQGAGFDGGETGVLRRHAPHWLRDSSLRSIVLSVEEAGRPHGGSGALYVRLRRRPPV
ncbi:Smr/MutS family protein [uncultured Rhodoblastus sp.]|uniref:Smr/MutS family protein n=1 Tax=uncultured Rhodoblastus sp. TaxID=543037 RepID=UPI0025CFBB04|nr:Smr/MutS family protein [uncultured Rhodoblastus sp.]